MPTPQNAPVALVTGAAGGIGRATALNLSDAYALILIDRDPRGLQETVQLVEQNGGSVHTATADITDGPSMASAVSEGEARLGTVNAAVACAGIEVQGTVADLDPGDWDRSLAVNLTGTYNTAKAVIGSLIQTKGTFTAIASDAGTQGAQGYAAYVAAKHGIVGLIRCMALDHGPQGVRSNVICPSFVETPMAKRLFAESSAEELAFYTASVPLGRFASPEEVASVARHFVTSTYSNGTVYAVDGGATAGYFIGSA